MKFITDNPNKFTKNLIIPIVFDVALLLTAVLISNEDTPAGFFTILRIITFSLFLYIIYFCSQKTRTALMWVAVLVAVIFNPFFVVELDLEIWRLIDWSSTIILLMILLDNFISSFEFYANLNKFIKIIIFFVVFAVMFMLGGWWINENPSSSYVDVSAMRR